MNTDFDFLHGNWTVANRRLVKRHVGSQEWDEFPGESRCHGFFDGNGNFDEIVFPTKGFRGATLRSYEPANRRWSLNWLNSRDGLLSRPILGAFSGDVGTFYGDDVDEGRVLRCRFIWNRLGPDAARWEQAYSVDGEQTWETNWVMEFSRA